MLWIFHLESNIANSHQVNDALEPVIPAFKDEVEPVHYKITF